MANLIRKTQPVFTTEQINKSIDKVVGDIQRAGGRAAATTPVIRETVGHALATDEVRAIFGSRGGNGRQVSKAATDALFPPEMTTGSGASGTRYELIGKSGDGSLGVYSAPAGRGRKVFLIRHRSGSRVWSDQVAAVKKAADQAGGWMWLPGERIVGLNDVNTALTTNSDGARPTGSGAYTDRRSTYPGSVQSDESSGARDGGPSASTPAEVRARSGQKPLRPGKHSSDEVLRRDLNRPDIDPRSTSYDRLVVD